MPEIPSVGKKSGVAIDVLKRIIVIGVCVAVGLLSRTALSARYSSIDTYQHEIEVLDNQKAAAATLSVTSATASTIISSIPDDVCSPIADQLADISRDLAIVTGAVLLEKYLLTIFGYAFFSLLIPICCVLGIVIALMPQNAPLRNPLMVGAFKVLVVGAILWQAVPVSVVVVDRINATYDTTINEAIEDAEAFSESAPKQIDAKETDDAKAEESEGKNGVLDWVQSTSANLGGMLSDTAANVADGTINKFQGLIAQAKVILTQITEGFAVLVVTTCVIPILIPLVMIWLFKLFFQPTAMSNAPMPKLRLPGKIEEPQPTE